MSLEGAFDTNKFTEEEILEKKRQLEADADAVIGRIKSKFAGVFGGGMGQGGMPGGMPGQGA